MRRRFTQGVRRKTSWEDGPDSLAGTVQRTASGSDILGVGAQLTATSGDGYTLTRVRGALWVYLSTITSAGDGFVGAIGLGICTAEAFAVGVSAVPIPVTDAGWDGWLWWQPVLCATAGTSLSSIGNHGVIAGASGSIEIDSRAQRKMEEGDTLYMAWELTEVGTAAINARFHMRTLFKLP